MRKIVSLSHMSLDGFLCGPNGEMNWITISEDIFNFVENYIQEADTGLYGPKTFAMMESYWPSMLNNPEAMGHNATHARWYAQAKKIVFSTKLDKLDNPAAQLVKNPQSAIEELKKEPGKNAMIFGSPRLVHSLTQMGLVDEYLTMLNPVILGKGVSLLPQMDNSIKLQLIKSTEFESGVVALHYKKLDSK